VDCRGSLGSFGELWRYSVLCMRLLHVKIVFANLLLYYVESVIKSVVL
jgi:hypothetical protein